MTSPRARTLVATTATVVLLVASGASAQESCTASLDASGMIRVTRGQVELATIELNAHGPRWQHAPQSTATAEVGDLPNQAGRRFVGMLPIPNTDAGAIRYVETVKTLPKGVQLEYDLAMTKAMRLNGLQVSIFLPVAQYAGAEVVVTHPEANPQIVGLPREQQDQKFLLWSGEGAKTEVARGTDETITAELRAATDVVIHDLRRWNRPVFEIRFPAIMQDQGREVAADDRFHLDLTVTFAAPVALEGP